MEDEWKNIAPYTERVDEIGMKKKIVTKVSSKDLTIVAKAITTLPENKKFLRKTERLIADRKKMFFESDSLDWAMGELLAYGTLLSEGHDIRLSGQDVERGTFSHRHAVLVTEESEEEIVLLNDINKDQGKFKVYNSLLSEYAVLGFDYGYAMASPNTLTIWEAQFGDFSNGAQIIIDQYIASGERKWTRASGLVMLLPHGYEGQGAEHSSARMERYLQMCAKDNMFVVNCSTPANMFHVLRRQLKAKYRKPLIVFTPKSLLRHPKAVSKTSDITGGLPRVADSEVEISSVKTVVFCSGKFYYDLLEFQEKNNKYKKCCHC